MKIFNKFFKSNTSFLLTINYLSHKRKNQDEIWKITSHFLNKIKDENKAKIHLNILATNESNWELNMPKNISYTIKYYCDNKNNYIDKIKYATSSNSPFSVKLDEDCFFSSFVWDYIIENIYILNDVENLLIAPLLSNNIPLVDLFINDFVKDDLIKSRLYNLFLNQAMPNGLWGIDYSPLNISTIEAKNWDEDFFYNSVNSLNTNKKGIHPIRLSAEAQLLLNEYILSNLDNLFRSHQFKLKELDRPYFTTSTFVIKTSNWKKLLKIKAEDNFDEIQLNIFKKSSNKKLLYISNGFGIHTVYNTIFGNKNKWNIGIPDGEQYEIDFVRRLGNNLEL